MTAGCLVFAAQLTACGDVGGGSGGKGAADGACGASDCEDGGRLGVEGASCTKTADCEDPLQCFGNVCTSVGGPGGPDASAPDDGVAPLDFGPQPDYGPPPTSDAAYEVLADFLPADPGPPPSDSGPPDVPKPPDGSLNPLGNCESLGIASSWTGSWSGTVVYDVPFEIPGAPSDSTLPVVGDMAFEIQCIDEKLVVVGDMVGVALDEYPFTLELQGGYNPETGALKAGMKNGKVVLFGFVTVLFEGELIGDVINPITMQGTWAGESVGTEPPGIPGTAEGNGVWQANPT